MKRTSDIKALDEGNKTLKIDLNNHGPGGCHSFQHKKKRFCKMAVKPGERYCGAHRDEDVNATQSETVRCHLCNDLIQVAKMASHLKRCNKVKEAQNKPKYYAKGINDEDYASDASVAGMKLAEFDEREIKTVIEYLNGVDDRIETTIAESAYEPMDPLMTELETKKATKALREVKQQSFILNRMDKFDLLKRDTCYIELGAGKGGLTERIAQSTSFGHECSFVIIDRATTRVKKERTLKESCDFERVKIDIADFDITAVKSKHSIVGIAKHLCGAATDLSIRGLRRCERLHGLAIVTCCHHRCSWSTFHSRHFLPEWAQDERHFRITTLLSSWATCGFHRVSDETDGVSFGLNVEAKKQVGRRAKFMLDTARARQLESQFGNAKATIDLMQYCSLATSPECRIILMKLV